MSTRDQHQTIAAAAAALALLLAFVLVGGAAARPGHPAGTAGTVLFTDPAGDAGGAPDITTISIGDDLESGAMEVSVTAIGMSTADPASNPRIGVYLNADEDMKSGAAQFAGSEYALLAAAGGPTMARWSGGAWETMPPSATISSGSSGDTTTWRFSRTDIGGPTWITFYAAATSYDGSRINTDVAPNGVYRYSLAVRPVIGSPTAKPATPRAGRTFTISFPVTRADNGRPLTFVASREPMATMTLVPIVKGAILPHSERLAPETGVAGASIRVPGSAKGKQLRLTLTITAGAQSATRVVIFRVK